MVKLGDKSFDVLQSYSRKERAGCTSGIIGYLPLDVLRRPGHTMVDMKVVPGRMEWDTAAANGSPSGEGQGLRNR